MDDVIETGKLLMMEDQLISYCFANAIKLKHIYMRWLFHIGFKGKRQEDNTEKHSDNQTITYISKEKRKQIKECRWAVREVL